MHNSAEQVQMKETVEHTCYLEFRGEQRVEVNCGCIGLYMSNELNQLFNSFDINTLSQK